jgi:hypothetical protein
MQIHCNLGYHFETNRQLKNQAQCVGKATMPDKLKSGKIPRLGEQALLLVLRLISGLLEILYTQKRFEE